jgi:hypothetical protein
MTARIAALPADRTMRQGRRAGTSLRHQTMCTSLIAAVGRRIDHRMDPECAVPVCLGRLGQPTPRRSARPPVGVAMWILTTSDGRRIVDIHCEIDARRIAHRLGITQLRGPYSWDVVDNQGRMFVAEIRHRSGGGGR